MSFTIKDFLNLDIITEGILLTSNRDVLKRDIESISVIELPVENFVHKGELVLSTCIGCENNIKVFKSFVKDVAESGATALVLSLGHHLKDIPREVIALGNELDLPIISIPWNIRFAGIIERVLLEINNIRQSYLSRFESLQKKLLTYFLDGMTLGDAAELIHREFGNTVVIVNTTGTIKGDSKDSSDLFNLIEGPLSVLKSEKDSRLLSTFDVQDLYTVYKISSKNMVHGYLYIKALDDPKKDMIRDNKNFVVRHIVSSLSLWFDREQTVFETEMHHHDNFVWDLINNEDEKFNELNQQAQSIGYNLSLNYICMVGLVNSFEELYKIYRGNFSSYEQWKFDCIKTLKLEVLRSASSLNLQIMSTFQKDRMIIFLEIKNDDVEKTSNEFLDALDKRLKSMYSSLNISWGIGENIIESRFYYKGYVDAKISLEVCHNKMEPGYRNIYHNPSMYRLLSLIYEHKDAQEITFNIIGKLINYDRDNGLDLLNTFKAYTENKGNVSQTARALHLHRQSLLYRLKRIEEITNLSLDNSDDSFLLELCVRLWDKQNNLNF